jgi:hypothetical protein
LCSVFIAHIKKLAQSEAEDLSIKKGPYVSGQLFSGQGFTPSKNGMQKFEKW